MRATIAFVGVSVLLAGTASATVGAVGRGVLSTVQTVRYGAGQSYNIYYNRNTREYVTDQNLRAIQSRTAPIPWFQKKQLLEKLWGPSLSPYGRR